MKSYIVDSFTKDKFRGNPAAVCVIGSLLSAENMQLIASEFNLSETAFIAKTERADHYSIRYFSPFQEIDLCGHATLASAKILFTEYGLDNVKFKTEQGIDLYCFLKDQEIVMEFPLYDTVPSETNPAMLKALGLNEIVNCEFNKENKVLLIEIKSTQELVKLKPDFQALKQSHDAINGVAISAASNDDFDFYSRYFWPWTGGNEDPVTGAIHTFLASYWGRRLEKKRMKAFQASERGGYLNLEIIDDERLLISSEAQIIMKGEMDVT